MKQYDTTKEWDLYQKGKDYNMKINLYNTVDKNERFYSGDQWNGVVSNGLPTPVFNIFKRVINYFVSSILSQKVKMQFGVDNIETETENPEEQNLLDTADILSKHSDMKWEKLKMDSLLRDGLLDAALSGDMVAYTYWDDSIDTGQTYGQTVSYDEMGNPIEQPVKIMGDFRTELVDTGNVMLGNVSTTNTQSQPYILIAGRDMVSTLREEAKRNGVSKEDLKKITGDDECQEQAGDRGKIELDVEGDNARTLYLIKLWKNPKTNTIWMNKSTKYCVIRKDVDLGIKLYPIALMNWDKRKNSYHGQAIGTGLIPNQIYINKQFAMVMKHMMDTAFGKVAYDSTRIASWNNQVGAAIPVQGDISNAVQQIQPGQMNNVVMEVIDMTISLTKELIGASDAALGDVKPENTSAIIAVQQSASVPLENVKQNLYQFVEDIGLIWLDFMQNKYDIPRKLTFNDQDKVKTAQFTGTDYKDISFNLKIDVGPSSYWSEITAMQTLDNLLNTDKLTFIQYLERVPNGIIPKKQELIDEIKAQMQDQNLLYQSMEQFMLSLPPEVQQQLQSLPPEEMEMQLKQIMGQQPNIQNNGGIM